MKVLILDTCSIRGLKVGEESAEVIIAAKNGSPRVISCEIADLLYNLLVLMAERKILAQKVYLELAKRLNKALEALIINRCNSPHCCNPLPMAPVKVLYLIQD